MLYNSLIVYMDDIFEKIIKREISAHFIYEDDMCVAILDRFPVIDGQTLIIPKKRVGYLFDLDIETYDHLFMVAKKIVPTLDSVFSAVRTCLVVEGLEIAHAHIKLYPVTTAHLEIHGGKEASNETLAAHAEKIRAALT